MVEGNFESHDLALPLPPQHGERSDILFLIYASTDIRQTSKLELRERMQKFVLSKKNLHRAIVFLAGSEEIVQQDVDLFGFMQLQTMFVYSLGHLLLF